MNQWGVLGEPVPEHLDPPEDEDEEDSYTNADASLDDAIDEMADRILAKGENR